MPADVEGSGSHKVAVLRTDHLGDVVIYSGAWEHLRRRFPDSEIVAVVDEPGMTLLRSCPHIDRILPRPMLRYGPWRRWPFGQRSKLARLTERWWFPTERYDLVIVPMRGLTAHRQRVIEGLPAGRKAGVIEESQIPDAGLAAGLREALTEPFVVEPEESAKAGFQSIKTISADFSKKNHNDSFWSRCSIVNCINACSYYFFTVVTPKRVMSKGSTETKQS